MKLSMEMSARVISMGSLDELGGRPGVIIQPIAEENRGTIAMAVPMETLMTFAQTKLLGKPMRLTVTLEEA